MQRFLTNPSEVVSGGSDNIDGNLILSKGELIHRSDAVQYMAIELLGMGTFGQVVRCVSTVGEEVAIKIVKSSKRFFEYGLNEVRILKRLKDAGLSTHFVNYHEMFVYKRHLCIVVELLGKNMYELIKILRFSGFELFSLRFVLHQVLSAMSDLHLLGITHCDLKPENILVADFYNETIKIVDFGSSMTSQLSPPIYIQSRFYRAPEVILGIPFGSAIDIWSLGCIAYELLMGHPLFPGKSNTDQIYLIHEFCPKGLPTFMLEHGRCTDEFFDRKRGFAGRDNPDCFTVQTMFDRIYSKHPKCAEIDLFIKLVLDMLEPSFLERPSSNMLLNHDFFKLERPEVNGGFHLQRSMLINSRLVHPHDESRRKLSMYDYGLDDLEDFVPRTRKGSMTDEAFENSFNVPL